MRSSPSTLTKRILSNEFCLEKDDDAVIGSNKVVIKIIYIRYFSLTEIHKSNSEKNPNRLYSKKEICTYQQLPHSSDPWNSFQDQLYILQHLSLIHALA